MFRKAHRCVAFEIKARLAFRSLVGQKLPSGAQNR